MSLRCPSRHQRAPVPLFLKVSLQANYSPKIECQAESKGGESKVYGMMRENRTRLAVAKKERWEDDGGRPIRTQLA
jgi:hypothetical protein